MSLRKIVVTIMFVGFAAVCIDAIANIGEIADAVSARAAQIDAVVAASQ